MTAIFLYQQIITLEKLRERLFISSKRGFFCSQVSFFPFCQLLLEIIIEVTFSGLWRDQLGK